MGLSWNVVSLSIDMLMIVFGANVSSDCSIWIPMNEVRVTVDSHLVKLMDGAEK